MTIVRAHRVGFSSSSRALEYAWESLATFWPGVGGVSCHPSRLSEQLFVSCLWHWSLFSCLWFSCHSSA